jgi:hypothetical protein
MYEKGIDLAAKHDQNIKEWAAQRKIKRAAALFFREHQKKRLIEHISGGVFLP